MEVGPVSFTSTLQIPPSLYPLPLYPRPLPSSPLHYSVVGPQGGPLWSTLVGWLLGSSLCYRRSKVPCV